MKIEYEFAHSPVLELDIDILIFLHKFFAHERIQNVVSGIWVIGLNRHPVFLQSRHWLPK